MEGHIYVYGVVSPWQEEDSGKYGEVNLKDISNQLTNNKEADTLIIHINSMGGDVYEGFAMHDVIRATGKKIITQAEGLVASIATVVFLAGDERRITENSQLMIHNPWGFAGGNADDVQKYADQLRKEEDRMAAFYSEKTGQTVDDLKAMMNEETYMTADEAISKGFATEKVAQLKAVALINNRNMTEKEINDKIEEKSNSIFSKIKALFKKQGLIKDLVLKTADDKNLDFGEDIQEASQIEVGSTATVDGAPAEGEFTMPDGTIYVFSGGAVTEIKAPAEPEPAPDAVAQENETLKAQLAERDASLKEAQETLAAVQSDLEAFKAQITSDIKGFKPQPPTQPDGEVVRKPFKSSK
jgi:ATP-dependent Clp endopeptidase proteolytic subunit ClpP